ncbi:MAG: hypothetical protein A2Z16_11925 [Chloroflexi bacterium RBG_16_54_18]|nr:MAG: hypothetical protein A2Z16_11925 [Chloroflexi bacterium RBG_16_54_18]
MELEQLQKQVDWLDEERRSDKSRIGTLEERLVALENSISPLPGQIKDLHGEITRLATLLERLDTFDNSLNQVRLENKKQLDDFAKLVLKQNDDLGKRQHNEINSVEARINEINKQLEQIAELKRSMQARIEGETRLTRSIDENRNRLETYRRSEEEYTRNLRLLEEGRRQDGKRLTDINGEVAALRKWVDEHRGKMDLLATNIKKVENRINEMAVMETERRETLNTFLDSQALREVERDKVWKEWQNRFQTIESRSTDLENMLQSLDNTNRTVKRSQQSVEELIQKVERNISEISEIQRLNEERFRQEWVTFRADDQKRWTNYTLTVEEQRSDTNNQLTRLSDRLTHIEDLFQELQDVANLANEHTEKRLQSILSMAHEWVSTFERTVGRSR